MNDRTYMQLGIVLVALGTLVLLGGTMMLGIYELPMGVGAVVALVLAAGSLLVGISEGGRPV
jgi:hypothetical protein